MKNSYIRYAVKRIDWDRTAQYWDFCSNAWVMECYPSCLAEQDTAENFCNHNGGEIVTIKVQITEEAKG